MRTPFPLLAASVIFITGCATNSTAKKQFQKPAYPPQMAAGESRYPILAYAAGLQGTTRLAVQIDANGKIARIRIIKSSGSILLDNAAVEAAAKSTFKPARDKDGKPIPTVAELPVTFALNAPKKAR